MAWPRPYGASGSSYRALTWFNSRATLRGCDMSKKKIEFLDSEINQLKIIKSAIEEKITKLQKEKESAEDELQINLNLL
jgi:hypothetical protein